jgi:hypothetical protein
LQHLQPATAVEAFHKLLHIYLIGLQTSVSIIGTVLRDLTPPSTSCCSHRKAENTLGGPREGFNSTARPSSGNGREGPVVNFSYVVFIALPGLTRCASRTTYLYPLPPRTALYTRPSGLDRLPVICYSNCKTPTTKGRVSTHSRGEVQTRGGMGPLVKLAHRIIPSSPDG